MIEQTDRNYPLLTSLFQKKPSLFEKIALKKYTDEDAERLYRDGESDLITINGKTWRFNWEEVYEFGIEDEEE